MRPAVGAARCPMKTPPYLGDDAPLMTRGEDLPRRPSSGSAYVVCAALALGCVSVGVALGVQWERRNGSPSAESGKLDPAALEAVVAQLVLENPGIWDSHPDADVARVLQRGLDERRSGHHHVTSNGLGLRERPIVTPKPNGTLRVVILGDSFIYGAGVRADDRLGRRLEETLAGRARGTVEVECIHAGILGWNLIAETQFLRRRLSEIDPDLVIHVSVSNDLDDVAGIHGFGALARSVPRHPDHAGAYLATRNAYDLHPNARSLLEAGLDQESRARYAEARERVNELAKAVEASGGRYVFVLYWQDAQSIAARELARGLDGAGIAYLPASIAKNPLHVVSPTDAHWSAAGHSLVARAFHGLIEERNLLPELDLEPWPDARRVFAELNDRAEHEARIDPDESELLRGRVIEPRIEFSDLTANQAGQVHGGVARDGLAGPYASMLLAKPSDAARLVVSGRFLGYPELAGGRVRVFIDEVEVGFIEIAPGTSFERAFEIPAVLRGRAHVSARFSSNDFVHRGRNTVDCVVFRLHRVSIEP